MNVTIHAKERYCERIMGMKDKADIKRYIAQNDDLVIERIKKLDDSSTFIWRGALGDNILRSYHIKDETILVHDTNETAIITLFKIDFGFTPELNQTITDSLMKEIVALQEAMARKTERYEQECQEQVFEMEKIDGQIAILNKKIEELSAQKQVIKADIDLKRRSIATLEKELDTYARKLCYSIEIRADVTAWQKG